MLKKTREKLFTILEKTEKVYKRIILSFIIMIFMTNNTFAAPPKIVTGTVDLFTEVSNWLLLIIPAGAGAVLGFHALQKSLTDDDAVIADKNKKMKNTLISAVIAETAVGIVRVVLGFYS